MSAFKTATTQAQIRKTKGSWVIPSTLPLRPAAPKKEPQKKKTSPLLAIPGELRNKIYAYIYDTHIVVEMLSSRDRKERSSLIKPKATICTSSTVDKPRPRWSPPLQQRTKPIETRGTLFRPTLAGLLLTCKQLNIEASVFFYAQTTFQFYTLNRLDNFLKVPTASTLALVNHLKLDFNTYGHPGETQWERYKEAHDASLLRIFTLTAQALPGLTTLSLILSVMDRPLRFTLAESWVAPLLAFSTTRNPRLKNVTVSLRSPWTKRKFMGKSAMWKTSVLTHAFFSQAIRRIITGSDEEKALVDYVRFIEQKYGHMGRWREELTYIVNPKREFADDEIDGGVKLP